MVEMGENQERNFFATCANFLEECIGEYQNGE
jgi:hypothetical protein